MLKVLFCVGVCEKCQFRADGPCPVVARAAENNSGSFAVMERCINPEFIAFSILDDLPNIIHSFRLMRERGDLFTEETIGSFIRQVFFSEVGLEEKDVQGKGQLLQLVIDSADEIGGMISWMIEGGCQQGDCDECIESLREACFREEAIAERVQN